MDFESSKKHSYIDEYKVLRTLGAGYHAEYYFINLESNWEKMRTESWWPSKNIKSKLPLSTPSNTN
jgi:hypothetical protein